MFTKLSFMFFGNSTSLMSFIRSLTSVMSDLILFASVQNKNINLREFVRVISIKIAHFYKLKGIKNRSKCTIEAFPLAIHLALVNGTVRGSNLHNNIHIFKFDFEVELRSGQMFAIGN